MYCPSCGAPHPDGAPFCLICRRTLDQSAPASAGWPTPFVDREVSVEELTYAGFWTRALALVLDSLLSTLCGGISALTVALLLRRTNFALAAAIVTFVVLLLAYQIIMTAYGGGFGMRIMGLRIIRAENGERPGYARAAARFGARTFFGVVPVLGGILQLGDGLWMIKDAHKQTWHDKVARTYVVEV